MTRCDIEPDVKIFQRHYEHQSCCFVFRKSRNRVIVVTNNIQYNIVSGANSRAYPELYELRRCPSVALCAVAVVYGFDKYFP